MFELDTTKQYRLADGRRVVRIREVSRISAWDNRGGAKACYELKLEDGEVQRDWYYKDSGARTGELGPDWDHPDNLISEEKYQQSLVDLVCNCGTEQISFIGYGVQARLRYMPYCKKCGCQYALEPAYRYTRAVGEVIEDKGATDSNINPGTVSQKALSEEVTRLERMLERVSRKLTRAKRKLESCS